jgi:surface-anchored protein
LIKALLALVLATAPTPSGDLDQTLDPGQSQATGRVVLETGHVDIGPRLRDGRWAIQIHDDHAVPSVWREPADTVLRVRDTARQQVPDDPAYAFLGEQPGTGVHVVPQTEKAGVVWIGWNTQDPGVIGAISRGLTLTLRGVQPLWVEANTHTHANWVFGRPGTYLLAVDISADLADGSTATASTVLRLAVGDTTEPDFDTAFTAPPTAGSGPAAAAASPPSSGTGQTTALISAGVLAVLIIAVFVARQSAVRRRAERENFR